MSLLGSTLNRLRNPLLDQPHDQVLDGLGFGGLDEVEVAETLGSLQFRHPALVDGIGGGDDLAFGGLAEDLRESHDRHRLGDDQIGEERARADRG